MKYFGYTILMKILKIFMYIKRGSVWCLRQISKIGRRISTLYANTLGFRLYKFGFILKKRLQKYKVPFDSRIVEVIGKRGTLQAVLLFIILSLLFPASKLYSQDITSIPGRKTMLYKIVGPGDQNFEEDTIVVEKANFDRMNTANQEAWRQGAVVLDTPHTGNDGNFVTGPQDIAGTSADGSALIKPTILPGSDLPTVVSDDTSSPQREKAIVYTVQPGDVIGAIAQKHGISVNTILWANDLSVRSYIRPGDELVILPEDGLLHVVESGESVNAIANKYDAEPQKIVQANKLQRDGSDIVIGEELFIPGGVKPRTIPTPAPQPTRKFVSNPISKVSAPPPSVQAPAGSGYIWPTSVRTITQYYGWRHTGVDIAGPIGSPLYAAKSGTVIKSQCGWNGGYGCYIILDHGGVHTLYAHASELLVAVGQEVTQGQTIALMGSTGRSTGPHIHFEVRSGGSRLNPLQYVK